MQSKCTATTRIASRVAIVELSGEVDGSAAAALATAYDETTGRECDAVLLDFAAVNYINSTGIALIVSVLARARAEGRRVVASGLSDHYRHIFDITRLSDFIQMFADAQSAADELAQGATA